MTTPAQPFHVLIAAAGSGERFGSGLPKQYALLQGKPVLRHTLETFLSLPGLASLHVLIQPDHKDLYHDAVRGLDLPGPIYGSNTRKSSINNGINALSNLKDKDILLIHDAVRPLVKPPDILGLLATMQNAEAATLATPVTDTLSRENNAPVSRDGLWALQTPQAFRFGTSKRAHAQNIDATDDTSLVSALGIEVKLVQGSKHNFKITVQEDLAMAETILRNNTQIRTGTGFDVHAFEREDKTRKLILCGITVDHEYGLAGHSDADVALHALTDAILGSIAMGDIGQHFPPSDQKFKNMDSRIFLEKACEMLAAKGGTIENADITIICETPKIGPYRDRMQAEVAEILKTEKDRVNIKATTTEGLGFTGRGGGIAAQAVVTIRL